MVMFWICLYLFVGTVVALIVEHEMNDYIDAIVPHRERKAAKTFSSILTVLLWPVCAIDAVRIVLAKMKGDQK